MVQICVVLMGALFIWEGTKGFRACGIKIGVLRADSEPLTGPKGRVVGSIVMGLGALVILFALIVLPRLLTL